MRGRQQRALQPDFDRALALHKGQQLDLAAQAYRRILKAAPDHFDALQLLGAIEGQQGHFDEALTLLREAIALKPDSANAHNNLGTTLASMQRHSAALASFERSLELRPDNPKALRNRGNALRKLNRLPEALVSLDRALELQPDFTDAMASRGETLQGLGRFAEAADAFRCALAGGKDLEMLQYALAALGMVPTPSAAPQAYVKGLFDDYAPAFDTHLMQVLKCRTPQLLAEQLGRVVEQGPLDIVDLGCGTGLCGPLLRPLAKRLVGVDLSEGMLARARATGHYERLDCAELAGWLGSCDERFDAAMCSDVLIYLGDLAASFAGVARVLRPGGVFVFSVEAAGDDVDFRLLPSRRYAHSAPYLRRLAQEHGLAVIDLQRAVLREDNGEEVPGLLVAMRRAAA
jgi:predicted TPR repeat methyltransferase